MAKRKKKQPKRYFNQQAVTIHKKNAHTVGDYFTLDVKHNNKAMRELSATAYKMYIYLCQYQTETTHYLSCEHFMKTTGVSEPSYRSSKKELIKKHYLNKREDGDFDFYNYPNKLPTEQEKIINEIIAKDKEKLESEN